MSAKWSMVEFGQVAELVRGISYKSDDLCEDNTAIPFLNLKTVERGGGYRADGLKHYSGSPKASQLLEGGDLLIAVTDLTRERQVVGSPVVVPNTVDLSGATFSLDLAKIEISSPNLTTSFLSLYLTSERAREFMKANCSGTTVMHLRVKSIPKMKIPLPPLSVQARIVDLVGAVDEHIENLKTERDKLDDVRHGTLIRLMSPGDSWIRATIDQVAEIVLGQSPPGSSYNSDGKGAPFLQGNAEFGFSHPEPVKWCDAPRKWAKEGDVLVSVRAPVGAMNRADQDYAIGRGLAALRGSEKVSTNFLMLMMEYGLNQMKSLSTGSTFAAITGKSLRSLSVHYPSTSVQEEVVDVIGEIDMVLAGLRSEINSLLSTRVQLVSTLLSGEVTIPESYDRFLTEVA